MKEYAVLALDLTKGTIPQNYSVQDANTVLRKAFLDTIGTDKIDFNTYRKHKYDIFEIIQETITPIINDRLEETMGNFAEVRNIAFGDSLVFDIENPELFEVAVIADGTGNIRRQRIDNGKLPVEMGTFAVKIYDEFYRFLSGRINWGQLVDKVVKSYERQIAQAVCDALYSYDKIDAELKYSGSYDEEELVEICSKIEALYGNAMIVGTKAALSKIKPEYVSNDDKGTYNAIGHLGVFRGYKTVALTQSFKPQTYEFNLSNSDLLILPASGEQFVKIVTEGESIILDEQNTKGDLSIEHTFIQKAGVAVGLTNKYGIVRFV